MMPLLPRIPLPLLPLCIKAVKKARSLNQTGRSALYHLGGALADLEDDLRALVEPRTVEDLCPTPFDMSDAELEAEAAILRERPTAVGFMAISNAYARRNRPAVCIDCGTSEPNGLCDSCAVLATGRLPS